MNAETAAVSVVSLLLTLAAHANAGKLTIGLTRTADPIEGVEIPAAAKTAPLVVLIAGPNSADTAKQIANYEAIPQNRRKFRLVAISLANLQGTQLTFPPTGLAYKENPESHYVWRWLGLHAPDLVLVAGDDSGLINALSANSVAGVGTIPARRLEPAQQLSTAAANLKPSEARNEMDRRSRRTPAQLARELELTYGHEWPDAVYVPGMALIGRMRLGHVTDVQRIVAPFLKGKNPLEKATGSHLAGHLVFAELAERTGDTRYTDLVRNAADLGFTNGQKNEAMPFHNEMSDAVFMSCPILARAGKLTGDRKYFDMALQHFRFMEKLCLRPDGLYRHSPLDEAAWGRGNAFPALGLALTLSDTPVDHPAHAAMLQAFRNLAATLLKAQNEDGMWRQVVDKPGAYSEFSATAMIGTALHRGIRKGWLDRTTYRPAVDSAWRAIRARVKEGIVVDVCESTGKQKSLQDYLNRVAILGKDQRGGGMAFLFAAELSKK
jgi:unsaturated rhamnogalacturonyl hydrolase